MFGLELQDCEFGFLFIEDSRLWEGVGGKEWCVGLGDWRGRMVVWELYIEEVGCCRRGWW